MLGPFELRHGEVTVRLPRKAQALLAYLAINRNKPVPKDTLATLLWGRSGTEQARASLRQCLAALRTALGAQAELLVSDTATLKLADAASLEVDAADFLAWSRSEDLPVLQKADALWRDELLAGMHISVEPFERWLAIERQRFDSEHLDLLFRMARDHAAVGDTAAATAACRQLLAFDPLREEGHRLLMTVLSNAGNRGSALLQYERCVEIVRDELGVEPDQETVNLAEAIRLGILQQDTHIPPPSPPTEPEGAAISASVSPESALTGPPLPEKPSVAIVPFANLSGDASQDYFVRGLVDDLAVALGRERWLFVSAGSSAHTFDDSRFDYRLAAAKLGVQYILKGSIRLDHGQLLVVVQLIDAARGTHAWSGRFQDQMDNLFALQDRLATKVAAAIAPALMSVEVERALHKPTSSLTAFDLYLRALPRFRTSKKDNEEALALLDRAIALDPFYASAQALAARCYQFQLMFDWRSPGDPGFAIGIRRGHEAADTGRNDPEALWMAALALAHLSGELDFAHALIERSLTLNPNSANAWIASCLLESYLGNTDMAIDHFQRARRLNPLDMSQHLHWNTVAWAYLGAGRDEEAADAAERTLRVQPDYPPGLRLKAVTCALLGKAEEARAATAQMLAKQPTTTVAWMKAFLQMPLQRNRKAFDRYIEGARLAGVPEGS
ncbi:MAG: winged helix-turn-helix domain-containing protein [Proteobacteria bacterium]|nr:winged helix-turn-helix domain-containing protein [Pseudomonadota bacterium]